MQPSPSSSHSNGDDDAPHADTGFWRFATEEELPPSITLLRTRALWRDKEHFQSSVAVKEQGLKRFLPGTLVTAKIKEVGTRDSRSFLFVFWFVN
jgi:hypothetical protein